MKRVVLVAAGAMLIIAGAWGYIWWHGPAETKEFTVNHQTTKDVLGSELTLISWHPQYFSTRYPSTLRILTSNEVAHGATLGQYVLSSVSLKQTDQLAVTVGVLDDMTLDDIPSVKFREQHADIYQQTDRSFIPAGGIVFSAKEGYETAAFWRHGNRYAAVVVSGSPLRKAELEEALEAVVTNWQWL